MLLILGRFIAIVVAAIMAINGAFMLVSPRAWYRLPSWLRAQGTLSEAEYGSGWGAVQLRIVGAAILAAIAWAVYSLLTGRRWTW